MTNSTGRNKWQNFWLSVIFHLFLPLLPILLELWLTGKISEKSLLLTTPIYAVSLSALSENRLLFGISIVISIVFSVFFGIVVGGDVNKLPIYSTELAKFSIICVFLASLIERYTIYVTRKLEFWQFL